MSTSTPTSTPASKPTLKQMVLIILDGWGYSDDARHNAIHSAYTPNWDRLWSHYPHTLINGSGESVGLPDGQMGNSEVGHLNMGAGRVVYQDFTRINKSIKDGDFFTNPVFLDAIKKAVTTDKAVHVMGLLSPGGVHSHEQQIFALIKLAAQQNAKNIYFHAFLDGRDTPPKSAMASLQALEKEFVTLGRGKIASIMGRYYAMDRDKRWERIQVAYDLLTSGSTNYHASSAEEGLEQAYARGETDEFVKPTAIHAADKTPVRIMDGDVVIFMNFRADRARQITRVFTEPTFTEFHRQNWPRLAEFVSLTQYAIDIKADVAFPPENLSHVLGAYIAELGLKQLRIAETEKYAHVTFFFNGGIEKPFPGEDRILVPSAKVATYDLQPQMSANELTDRLVAAIRSQQYALIVCNYANPDMVGHTGNFAATVKAIETIDQSLGKILDALLEVNAEAIITADHGNAECMYDEKTKQPHTAHTCAPIPCIYVGRPAKVTSGSGTLSDIAPTILYVMELSQPAEMTGHSLLELLQ